MIESFLATLKSLADAFILAVKSFTLTPEEEKAKEKDEADKRIEAESKQKRPDRSIWK
jgi:hypothetical protein